MTHYHLSMVGPHPAAATAKAGRAVGFSGWQTSMKEDERSPKTHGIQRFESQRTLGDNMRQLSPGPGLQHSSGDKGRRISNLECYESQSDLGSLRLGSPGVLQPPGIWMHLDAFGICHLPALLGLVGCVRASATPPSGKSFQAMLSAFCSLSACISAQLPTKCLHATSAEAPSPAACALRQCSFIFAGA